MEKSTHEEQLSQTLQTNNKQFKIAINFLTRHSGIFNVTDRNIKSYSTESINDDDFNKAAIPPGGYEVESLNNEIKRIMIEEGYYTEGKCQFLIVPIFSTLGSFIKFKSNLFCCQINFVHDDSIRDLLGFDAVTFYEEYSLSPNPVDILYFDIMFLKCIVAQGLIVRGKRSGTLQWVLIPVVNTLRHSEEEYKGICWTIKILFQV